ncbi:uncharacterized protein LOC143370083 [Andrena cerasifolii]|uniref:uncharacterized protein LOC143370083 n=1 Tax=Andrena cerasifolii TaxID=2819439 RepID=UPI004037C026
MFQVSHYKPLKKYLIFLGQYPSQTDLKKKSIVIGMVVSVISFMIPLILQFYVQIRNKNLDRALETLPPFVTCSASISKLLSLHINRENFRKVFLTVETDWKNQVMNKELDILEEITGKGSTIAYRYRGVLLSFGVTFVALPLINPMLDILIPLNETREREETFSLYYFVNNEDHFYPIYLHSVWITIVTIVTIVTVDSLNMIITHHASAMFAICGSMIDKATEYKDVATVGRATMDDGLEKIRECVAAHNKAIEFFEFLDTTNRINFLLQVGLGMAGVSVTAFQTIMHLDNKKEAARYVLFFGGQNFHLFFLSLPGQVLSDYSTEVLNHIYNSKWYRTSAKMQRMMNLMQLRASKPCQLTAGGLYNMNIENFGAVYNNIEIIRLSTSPYVAS